MSMVVSRTSVRNAINKLVTLGLLEHRQGQGPSSVPRSRVRQPADRRHGHRRGDPRRSPRGAHGLGGQRRHARRPTGDRGGSSRHPQQLRGDGPELADSDRIGTISDTAFHMAVTFRHQESGADPPDAQFLRLPLRRHQEKSSHMYMNREALEEVLKHHREIFRRHRGPERQRRL